MSKTFSEGIQFVQDVHKSGWETARQKAGFDESEARRWWSWYERDVCLPWVVYEGEQGTEELKGADGAQDDDVDGLPLVTQPGRQACFADKTYRLERQGLYRFIVLTRSVRNVIVGAPHKPLGILRGLSALQIHGNRDDGKSVDELRTLLLTRAFLSITCGTIASVAVALLKDLGFRARLVASLTLEEWNTYDNGHCLCEVFFPEEDKWVLVDVDFGFVFRKDGILLSAYEFWDCLQRHEQAEFLPLSQKLGDPFFLSPSGFNYFLYLRHLWRDLEGKKAWYRRILQVIAVRDEGKYLYFGREEKIRSYWSGDDFEVLPLGEWRDRLYKGQFQQGAV